MDNNLKHLLEQRGLTVSELARICGISQPTLHKIVSGRVNLLYTKAENYIRIAHGLGLSTEQLYYGDMSYDERKYLIDRVYASTTNDGRRAMLANAVGIERGYPHNEPYYLPTITDDIVMLKAL